MKKIFQKLFYLNLDYNKRIFGLDVFRTIAILLVVLSHGGFLLKNTFLEGFPWFKMIDGVDFFFVLSGLLIGTMLLKEIHKRSSLNIKELFSFWKRRWFRTLPNYYLILLANWVVVKNEIIIEDIKQFNAKFFIFSHNFSSSFYGFFWESWSLSTEEWFYILFPIILLLLLLIFSSKKAFLFASVLLILMPLSFRIYLSPLVVDDFGLDINFRKIVIGRLDSIGYGILAAWTFFFYKDFWIKTKYYFFIAGIILLVFVLNYDSPPNSFYSKTIYFSLCPISAMFFLPFADQIKQYKGKISKIITHISVISYSMYLINLALVAEVIRDNFPTVNQFDGLFKYIIFFVIVIVASTWLYKFFEKPMMDLRDKI